MNHRRAVLCVATLILAIPAFGRVLSYSPYSNRTSLAGFHERNTRHFVLIESIDDTNAWDAQQLVLYDTAGGEPRVVYPPDGGTARIDAAALYERKNSQLPPMLMATIYDNDDLLTIFSPDGGTTWKIVPNTKNRYLSPVLEPDLGGPSVLGLTNPIRSGTDAWPFIVSYSVQGIYVITANGEAEPVLTQPYTLIVGQDRTGTRLLFRDSNAITYIDLNAPGGNRKTLMPVQQGLNYSGWITADGSAYIQVMDVSGRYLYLHRNNETQFLMGPYGATPPALTAPWPWVPNYDSMRFFAVPTHDFEGAWMLQRESGQPTTLSRHTLANGTQPMWSDVSGPQVEALIAGNSGQTLLIQVHRDRSVQMQRLFIDPALAVWRVGEPMPRHYDELFLNEEWNKGFIHVDVDRVAEGEPFVFNSGASLDGGEVIISPGVGGGGDVIQEWGVVRASLRQHLVLPGVARLNGAFDSRWLTDVTIYNPLATTQTVDIRFIALGEPVVQASAVRQQTITLQPREIRFIPDVLHSLFAINDGGGALHFLPASGINVVGRTYSHKGEGGGTFGFGMQAIDLFNAAGPRFPVTFAGAFPGQNFRTNVLLTDTSGVGTEAALLAYGVTGPIGSSTKTIDAPPGGVLQFNGMARTLGLLSRDAGGLVVQPTRGTAIATVVAIDNRTNDPTYFPPDLPASDQVRAIPVIGHVDGANGSHFRSDVYLFNPTSVVTTVTLEAKQWNSPAVKVTNFTLLPREARVVADALPTLFQMTGLARLRYWSNTQGDGVRVTSRTYTIDEHDATYGSLIPPLNNFQIAGPGDSLEILGVTGSNGFRTNLGLVELSPSTQFGEVNVRVRVLDEMMNELDTFPVTVARAGGMQINDLFGSRGIVPPEAAMLQVQVLDGGLIGAYATLVDNITNDSTYLGAQLAAQEN